MNNYGFFGGSFNPPTYAHLEIIKETLKQMNLNKAFFVPVGNSYKKSGLIDELDRYNMLKLLSENEENIEVEQIELNNSKRISTIDAFKIIQLKYINSNNYFIMGADNLLKLPNWKDSDELIKNFKLIVFERVGFNIKEMIKNNEIILKNINNIHILKIRDNVMCRSGIIRDMIKNNNINFDELEKYTKKNVIEYILENKLYV